MNDLDARRSRDGARGPLDLTPLQHDNSPADIRRAMAEAEAMADRLVAERKKLNAKAAAPEIMARDRREEREALWAQLATIQREFLVLTRHYAGLQLQLETARRGAARAEAGR